MDAPLLPNTTTTTTVSAATPPSDSASPPVRHQLQQESSIFSYINNLSPIKPDKAAHVIAGFPGLSSSPGTLPSPPVHPEENFPERLGSERNQLHSGDLLELDVSIEKSKISSNETRSQDTQSSNSRIDCEEDPSDIPSGCSHGDLTDTVEVGNENQTPTAGSSFVQSHHTPQSSNDYTSLEDTNPQFGDKNKSTQDAANEIGASKVTPELLEYNIQGNLSFDKMHVESNEVKGLNKMPSDVGQKVETSSLVDHSSTEQYYGFSVDQEAALKDELDIGNQSVQKCQDSVLTGQPSKLSVEGVVFKHVKGQHRRGLHKRCLQFDDAHQIVKARTGSSNFSDTIATSQLPVSPANLDDYNLSGQEVSNVSCSRQLDNLTKPVTSLVSRRSSGSSRSNVSKPLGIGLHLNSIISAMPIGCGAGGTMRSLEKGSLIVQGGNLASVMGSYQPENIHGSVPFDERDKSSASIKDGSNETQPLVTDGSFASQSSPIALSSHDPALPKQIDYRPTPSGKRKYISEDAVGVKELDQSSPKKKKKKTSTTSNGDGCKRCNCKKTKCLKLYCDCFAAGIYCADTCACQGCFNRPEYEDTVLETRQQIESRNPLAFAPKIVRTRTESPAVSYMDSGNISTPASGRHKRGCNCKKSMCLKKYCECYQANVGCSSGCRCEGCKNVFGRKEEFGKDGLNQEHERYQSASTEVPEWVGRQGGLVQTELCDHQNFTPQTPAFQFSDRVNDVSRPQFSNGGFSSPETDFSFLQKSPDTTRMADNYDMTTNAYTDTQGIGYYHQNTLDEHTQPNTSIRALDYSLSSKVAEWKTSSRSQLFPSSINSSVYQHCSAITPVTQFGGSKLVSRLEFDEKQHDILEDDTPEILKDTSNPFNAVKSTSPNKKRVSPPQGHVLASGSSVGLKSGRKFILRAVQSFPPLTPCIDSKNSRSLSKIETKNAGTRNDE